MDNDLSVLHADLLNALDGQLQNGQQLFDELVQQAPRLQAVLTVAPRNAQEENEIKSGKVTLDGGTLAINQDFAQQVIFVSQQLSCSERYIAGLVRVIAERSPTIDVIEGAEQTVIEFHTRRRALVNVLYVLFQAAEAAEQPDAPHLCKQLAGYLHHSILTPASGDLFPAKVFKEMEGLTTMLTAAEAKRQAAPTNTGNNLLARNIVDARCRSLQYERRVLAQILTIIARLGLLSSVDIQKQLDWLATQSQTALGHYIFTATASAFDPVDPTSPTARSRAKLALDTSFMEYMKRKFDIAAAWKEPGLKSALSLKWMFLLIDTRHADASLDTRPGFRDEDFETQLWNAIQSDAFVYLLDTITHLQRKRADYSRFLAGAMQGEQDKREIPPPEFQLMLFRTVEALVRQMIMHTQGELRKIKQRQEDLFVSGTRTERHRMFRGSSTSYQASASTLDADKPPAPPRNDVAVLFNLIGALYSALPPESGLQFWTVTTLTEHSSYLERVEAASPKMFAFLSWAASSSSMQRDFDLTSALYRMFAGVANGKLCSEMMYNYMVRGGSDGSGAGMLQGSQPISWANMFKELNDWAVEFAKPPQNRVNPIQSSITPQKVVRAMAFLELLATVAKHSVPARLNLSNQKHLKAITTLLSLIPLPTPLELKGAIFDALAAFCIPGAGKSGVDTCGDVWREMETMEVINVRDGIAPKGVSAELEQLEEAHHMYPATLPFLKLLCTLIHTKKLLPPTLMSGDFEPVNKIPATLGLPYRPPGIQPYVSFVLESVYGKVFSREYLRPSDRWEMCDACLAFIERCLASFDLEGLVDVAEDPERRKVALQELIVHPGYDVMKRLLTRSALQENILKFIADSAAMFDKEFAEEEPLFASNVVRVLRIVHRVLEVQDIFVDVLIPLLEDYSQVLPAVGEIPMRSMLLHFDQALSYDAGLVSSIAGYVAYPQYPELVILSVKTLSLLCSSNALPNLGSLIERSDESEQILSGFRNLLLTRATEDVSATEDLAESLTGAGAPDPDPSQPLGQAIRLAILNLLLQNTKVGRPQSNLAHFLLFGTAKPIQHIKDPHEQDAMAACLHAVLDVVDSGIPRRQGKGKERAVFQMGQTPPLFVTHPTLVERCYHLLYNLCVHPATSEPMLRYLRTHEDFFARHLAVVPFHVPEVLRNPSLELTYGDGSRIATNVQTVSSFLGLRGWIMELVALELLTLTRKGNQKSTDELLGLLFDTSQGYAEEEEYDDPVGDLFKPFQEIGQSNMRIIELLQSQEFEWVDGQQVDYFECRILGWLDLQACNRFDDTGCPVIDSTELLKLLDRAKTDPRSNRGPNDVEQWNNEIKYILASQIVENNRRRVRFAQQNSYAAWRKLLEITLTNCFDRLPHDRRENLLFDLLHVLPTTVQSPGVEESTAILLSEVILSCITKLREDRRHQFIMQSAGGDNNAGSLPTERLYGLLRSILECILAHNRIELVRGNLYASLINYLYLIASPKTEIRASSLGESKNGLTKSFSLFSMGDDLFSSGRASPASLDLGHGWKSASNLEAGSLTVLKGSLDRLISFVCRDAVDGSEVWKTVSFMLMDALVQLSQTDRTHATLQSLVRRGYLANFVRGLKESDLALQGVLKPDPDDLNPLYVYEAKMSFLVRVAETRSGAERLLECRLLPTLGQCDYLEARPEIDPSFMDMDNFLPSAIVRYHQILVPALQLALGIMTTMGNQHTTSATQTLDFLSSHRDTLIILLKNDDSVVSLSMVEELHLVVALCTSVASYVPKEEVTSSSGYGAIHAAVLGLAARCIGDGRLTQSIRPTTDTEMLEASVRITSRSSDTKFDRSIHEAESALRQALLTYLATIGDPGDAESVPVLSSVVAPPRGEDRSSHFVATTPTIGDAIECLRDLSADLKSSLRHILDLTAELQHRDVIRVDGVEERIEVPQVEHWSSFDLAQKRALVAREYERLHQQEVNKAQKILDALEMLLLLILQHVDFFSAGTRVTGGLLSTKPSSKSMTKSLRFAAPSSVDAFHADVAKEIGPVLHELESIDIGESIPAWRSSRPFVEIICRRLRDLTGLHHDEAESS